jgi:hypothetical protein
MLTLAKKKASIRFDEDAKKIADEIQEALKQSTDLEKIAKTYEGNDSVSYESVENVEATNLDSGRATMAASLEKVGDVSSMFVSRNGDGYYFVKLTAHEEGKVSYASIWVRFKWLDEEMKKLRAEGHIKERIDLNVEKTDETVEAPAGEEETEETKE